MSDSSAIHRMKTTVAQHSGETHPQALLTDDVTLEEVLHLIQLAGYGVAYPALRAKTPDGPLPNNLLTDAMRIAQQNGDYTRFDSAAGLEYFYLLGTNDLAWCAEPSGQSLREGGRMETVYAGGASSEESDVLCIADEPFV